MTEALTDSPTLGVATRSKRASAMPADERRAMIVTATLPLLLEHGDRVTSRQIAEAAGIAEGTIFRVFADKDEIIAAVIEAAVDPQPLETALGDVPDHLALEDRLAAAVVIIQQRVIDIWRLLSSVGTRFHEIARRPMADSDALVRLLEADRDRLSLEPVAAARMLRALTLSVTHPMLVGDPGSPYDIVHVFLHGVAKAKPSC